MSERVQEVTDADFVAVVSGSTTPVVVDLWATWCPPCRLLAPRFEEHAQRLAGKYKFVKVDTDQNPVTSQALGIRSIPTLILFKDGKEVRRVVGADVKFLESLE